jgi:hypothetical protein
MHKISFFFLRKYNISVTSTKGFALFGDVQPKFCCENHANLGLNTLNERNAVFSLKAVGSPAAYTATFLLYDVYSAVCGAKV